MAITSFPDWSLASIIPRKRTHHSHTISTCKFSHLLSSPTSNRPRFLHSNLSNSPSSILEEDQEQQQQPPPNTLDLKVHPSSSPSSNENLNEFLSGLLQAPQSEELVYEYYEKAKEKPEFRPEQSTLTKLILYLVRSKKWDLIISTSKDFKDYNVPLPDKSTYSALISSCIKARKIRVVEALLQVCESDNEITPTAFETAMKGYNKLHMFNRTILIFQRAKRSSSTINADPGCYYRVMEAYLKSGDSEKAVELFHELVHTHKADLKQFSPPIYRIHCESLARSGRVSEAIQFFRKIQKNRVIQEDVSIYSALICSVASNGQIDMAEELFKEAESKNMLRDPEIFLKLILMYIQKGLMEKTLEVVNVMKTTAKLKVTDCIFCAIVNGYSKHRGYRAAVKGYEELTSQGCEPGQVTYASIINAYCRLGLNAQAETTFEKMIEKGFDKCVVAYSSMVAMYGKTGRLREGMRLVAKMKEKGCQPNVWIYNTLMDLHGKGKDLRQVEKVWKEMKRRKVKPDKVSYSCIISAYHKAGEYEMCERYYHEYRVSSSKACGGGGIDKVMGGIMVGVFSKTSRVDELVKLLRDMKSGGTELDARLFKSALNALRDAGLQSQAQWFRANFVVR